MSKKTKKLLILNLPYAIIGLIATNVGEAWRIAVGETLGEKILAFLSALGTAFSNPLPSFHPFDLLIGVCIGAALRLVVYVKSKNAKKYRHNEEYGSARWGTAKDIAPFVDADVAGNEHWAHRAGTGEQCVPGPEHRAKAQLQSPQTGLPAGTGAYVIASPGAEPD